MSLVDDHMELYFVVLPKEINTIIFSFLRCESLRSLVSIYPEIICTKQFWDNKINKEFGELISNLDNMKREDPRKILINRLLTQVIILYDSHTENERIAKMIDMYIDISLIYDKMHANHFRDFLNLYTKDSLVDINPYIEPPFSYGSPYKLLLCYKNKNGYNFKLHLGYGDTGESTLFLFIKLLKDYKKLL